MQVLGGSGSGGGGAPGAQRSPPAKGLPRVRSPNATRTRHARTAKALAAHIVHIDRVLGSPPPPGAAQSACEREYAATPGHGLRLSAADTLKVSS